MRQGEESPEFKIEVLELESRVGGRVTQHREAKYEHVPRKHVAEWESGSRETCQELFPDCLCEIRWPWLNGGRIQTKKQMWKSIVFGLRLYWAGRGSEKTRQESQVSGWRGYFFFERLRSKEVMLKVPRARLPGVDAGIASGSRWSSARQLSLSAPVCLSVRWEW